MIIDVFTNYVQAASVSGYSQPFSIGENNTVATAATLIVGTTVPSSITIEGSNDLNNWEPSLASLATLSAAPSFKGEKLTSTFAHQYLRVKVTTGAGAIVLNLTLNLTRT